jgi:type III restriction enzyme
VRLHFDANMPHQRHAIEAVCALFSGQEHRRDRPRAGQGVTGLSGAASAAGHAQVCGNRLDLTPGQLLANLQAVQQRQGLPESRALAELDFTVDMETGTGKTYVYLRTLFELNKRYGYTKFVIVVPSVAIKEGVHRSLEMTREHFKGLYPGVPCECVIYDSRALGAVLNFATSPHIQVMIATVGAINKKDVNNLYKAREETGGEKPIDIIAGTRPIIIVDEPQSVDGGLSGAGRSALTAMHPLCTLRYSATHVDAHHLVYRLDAIDAYAQRLVKRIEVASPVVAEAHNRPYARLIAIEPVGGSLAARMELDVLATSSVERVRLLVRDGDQLEDITKRALYTRVSVGEIRRSKRRSSVILHTPDGEMRLEEGQEWGEVDAGARHREMMRCTIIHHFDKELALRPLGIKVLSLFFIDAVSLYRRYDQHGRQLAGTYARIFEDEYQRVAQRPEYGALFRRQDAATAARDAHAGYFSIDRLGRWSETSDSSQGGREDAERVYALIMRDKERLLSFETPLAFIFSHSALREGWDNPNVFQICALRDMNSERERRQTVGRGMRLCVNQDGERQQDIEVNTVTIIANESYEQFARSLQQDIEADTGKRFGVIDPLLFATVQATSPAGDTKPLGAAWSRRLHGHLASLGLIEPDGTVRTTLREALITGAVVLPEAAAGQRDQILTLLDGAVRGLEIGNASRRASGRPPARTVLEAGQAALRGLLDRPVTFRTHFDHHQLVHDATQFLRETGGVPTAHLGWRTASISLGVGGISVAERAGPDGVAIDDQTSASLDVLTPLLERTRLTRRSLYRILAGSGALDAIRRHPEAVIESAHRAIIRAQRRALGLGVLVDHRCDQPRAVQALFTIEDLLADVRAGGTAAVTAAAHVQSARVTLFRTMTNGTVVRTPLGEFLPDCVVLIEDDAGERCYALLDAHATHQDATHEACAPAGARSLVECLSAHAHHVVG